MIRPQSSMSKHIPVSSRRIVASRAGNPRPAPHPRCRLCSEPGVSSSNSVVFLVTHLWSF
ncbi:hypothetical protein G5576_111030 [Homo sapiens]|uniref:Uncharacterized protein n=1 Tax=Homo sapiens TaxID=9606 RepID=A0A5F9ZHS0_HUMAN|nr:hypothetical protein KI723_060978 [Homo sapiens]KAI4018780.1 hypothetical protein G5576_111030 [Homo sapiens]